MKVAEIFCTVTKGTGISDFNPVMQISLCLQNTASWTQLSIKKDRIVQKSFSSQKFYSDTQYIGF